LPEKASFVTGLTTLETMQYSRYGKPYRADGCKMISDGASQATGRFARKTCLLALWGNTKVLTDAKRVNCVVVNGYCLRCLAAAQVSTPWREVETVMSTLAGAYIRKNNIEM
jgi:hypothetical protein